MGCTAIIQPPLLCEEFTNQKQITLDLSERVLKNFGYPLRAKYLVESIECILEDFGIEYRVTFIGRKRNKNLINTRYEYKKSYQQRSFYTTEVL
jgi:hypothetical protein